MVLNLTLRDVDISVPRAFSVKHKSIVKLVKVRL